ncbi:hypothetical protein DITRI_Ditri14bG0134200 [Diplodiscus trichospermus]
MAEFVASAAANTVGNLATEYASPYASFFFNFGKIVEDFKYWRNQLELKIDRVKNDVDEAIRQTEVIEKDVQDWLTRAEKELGEAQNLEDEIERNKCFKWCPNLGWRYCLSKKVAKKTLRISRLLETSDFPRVGRRAPLQGIEFLFSKDFMPSESSKAAFNGIIKALSCNGVNIIGLYGMPGVGKTTLAEVVGKQAIEQRLFDKVVICTVSQTPNINEIQNKIADILDLELKKTTEGGKAEELWRRLKDEKKILIIVDDVWNRLELKRIGIPFGTEHEGCKILLTTRREQVCTEMNCQERFPLKTLSYSEAWALFQDNAGLENASPTLIDVAKKVARECNGLPLAIVTMGRALKDETLDGWEIVNQRLKDSRHLENQDVCGDIYSRLKISYDYLKGNNSRTCLQLCSLFQEDHEIRLEELTIYGLGQGMFRDVNSIEDARREMRVTITNLQKSGLLLETNDISFVKMHDVVRDFVHWITLEGENMFLVKSGLKEWPRSESLGCYTAISLINSTINNFPERLEFPKLEAFLLDGWETINIFYGVPSLFFQGMKALKVLVLRRASTSLEGLQFLPNLRTMHLESCELRNVSSLGNLKELEILVIDGHSLSQEPMLCYELRGLTTLRLLSVCPLASMGFSLPKNFFSSFVQLEELNLTLHIEWASTEKSADRASLSEVCFLPRLTHLSLQVSSECIPENFVFPKLQRYNIVVYERSFSTYPWLKYSRRLTITKFSLTAFEELFCNVELLDLSEITDLEYLIDTTKEKGPKSAFNNLVRLTLDKMICLKELCHGLPPIGFLQKLEFLTIKNCPNAIFEVAAIKNLKELMVEHCEQLQVIFQMDGVPLYTSEEIHAPLQASITSLHLESLPELRSIWTGPSHHISLKSLRGVTISCCNKLKSVFPLSFAQTLVHLKYLVISICNGLEQIIDCAEGRDGTEIMHPDHQFQSLGLRNLISLHLDWLPELRSLWTAPSHHVISLQSLREVTIRCCGKLKSVFPLSLAQTLVHLERLVISMCNELEQVFDCAEGRDGTEIMHPDHQFQALGLQNLISLHLEWLPELRSLWTMPSHHVISLQSLREVTIRHCNKLNFVFPFSLARSLVHLEGLVVSDCDGLEQVFYCAEETDHVEDITLPQLQTLELKGLISLRNFYTGNNFVKLPSLKKLAMRTCGQLTPFKVGLEATTIQYGLEGAGVHVFKELSCSVEHLTLHGNISQKSLALDTVQEKLNELTLLELESCGDLECLIEQTPELYNHDQSPERLLPKLQELIVRNCNDMLSVIPATTNLEKVTAEYCAQLQVIFQMQGSIPARKENEEILLLSNLKELKLDLLPELRCIWKGPIHHVNLQSLKVMIINGCDKLDSLFSPSLAQTLLHLEELWICFCRELAHIISPEPGRDYHGIVSNTHLFPLICWPKLKTLTVRNCQKLEYVFPITLAQGLEYLEVIMITNSPKLKQLFNNIAEEKGNGEDILLPRLRSLVLEDLENLSSLCQRNYFVMSPSLMFFGVGNCPKFTTNLRVALQAQLMGVQELFGCKEMICCSKNLTRNKTRGCRNLIPDVDPEGLNGLTSLELHNFGDLEFLYDTTEHRQPTIAFSNLVELVMEEMIGLKMLCNNQPPNRFLQKLEKLKIKNCMNMASLSPVGQNLKEVMIKDCGQLQEIFRVDEVLHSREANQAPLLSNLTRLELKSLSELRCIWKGPSHPVINLQSLEIVKISNCNRLRCLFSPSFINSLVHLERLFLRDLPELEQLITELESDPEQEQQVLNKVKEKVDGQHELFLPSLKKIGVSKCPRLAPFIIQQEVNNQAQVKGLYLSNQHCNSFDILLRQSLPNLEHFTFGNHLQFLKWLIVSYCSKLKSLFSPMLAQSLPHLSYLYIKQCEELGQIIDRDTTSAPSSQGHVQSICFPCLIEICIEECSNLKSLFSVSVTLSLSQLKWFTIRGVSKLEQVFEYQGGIDIEDAEKEIVLPQLRILSLKELPRLKSFIPMGYRCSFPKLDSLKVEKCPSLTTSFSTESTIHARTKAVADVPMDGFATDADIMEVSDRDGETTWQVGSDINWRRVILFYDVIV